MSEHHLTNPRTIYTVPPGTPDPVCWQCKRPLAEVPLSGITTRAHKRTYCSEPCYQAHIAEAAVQAVRDHVASGNYKPPRSRTLPHQPSSSSSRPYTPPKPTKSAVRQTAEAGANVVGFIIWLAIISAIAAAIFYLTGIDTTR